MADLESQKSAPLGEYRAVKVTAAKTPRETVYALMKLAEAKLSWPMDKYLFMSFLAGCYICLGGFFAMSISRGFSLAEPGLVKLLQGACFPLGLVLIIVFSGCELFTGNCMYYLMSCTNRSVGLLPGLYGLVISYIGNYMGTQLCVFLFGYVTEIYAVDPWLTGITAYADAKCASNFGIVLLKAIPANFLVCAATYFATMSDDLSGKIIGVWITVGCFTATGWEHCIANMFYVPLGIMYGAQSTYGMFIYKCLIPSTIGNILGGGVFLGMVQWYLYYFGEEERPEKPEGAPLSFKWTKFSFIEAFKH